MVTIVVPTRDRPHALRRCLDALASQVLKDEYEVLVVDDGSIDGDAVATAASGWPMVRALRQPAAGPAAARNAGVRAARGDFICFTDDDCEPEEEWAARLVAALRRGADAVGGRTIAGNRSAVARASELIAHAPAESVEPGGALSFTPSNNLGCRAVVVSAVPFDEGYPAAAGEDREWCARLRSAGYSLRHEPAAALVHRQALGISSFFSQQVRYGRGAFRFRRMGPDRRSIERPVFYARLLRRAFAEGPAAGVLVFAAQIATAVGFVAEWLRTRSERLSDARA
jgi:glycosyltransferase involved in cell wall biosynthesis